MITITDLSFRFSGKPLFENVNVKFTPGNCYGVIGANGAGKTTFIKILSGELEPSSGQVTITPGERLATLEQNHFAFDEYPVLETVMMGYQKLHDIMKEKEALYSREDFSEADGLRAADLEHAFEELNGWEAESDAEKLLTGLGVSKSLHSSQMKDLSGGDKVKVLLAQSLFGNPQILLLDEPTNHLDFQAIRWLEEFLIEYPNTVIVVSHDRHFLNKVCTHMMDIDFGKARLVVGNYDFWYESSQLMLRLMNDRNKKKEDRIQELQAFIARFGSNASKARQATSRKKMLEKIVLDDIQPSSRRYPFIGFSPAREAGKDILTVENLGAKTNGSWLFRNLSFSMNKGDKIAFLARNEMARTVLFEILAGEREPDEGTFRWGKTTSQAYLPKDNTRYFEDVKLNLIDWIRQYSSDQNESYCRGFLGKMLFSGDDATKQADILSGGEKMRCMFSRLMLSSANVLILDEPTNHLDLESITAVNNGLAAFKGSLLFASHDYKFIETIADRVIEIGPTGLIDSCLPIDEYLEDATVQERVAGLYAGVDAD